MHTFSHNAQVALVLIRRELKYLSSHIISILLDCLPALCVQVITFGYLFPLMGSSSSMIAPMYLGSMLALFLQLGFAMVMKTGFDLEYSRFIDYHITLPLPKKWLFGAYIINHMIYVAIITVPLFTIGTMILHAHFDLTAINWLVVILMYTLVLAYFSTLFLGMGYTLSLQWIMDNSWPRLLAPLWWIGGGLILWKKVYAWFPSLAYVMLLNPITYVSDGIRSAFLGTDSYIAWYICAIMLSIFITINCLVLSYGMKKKLDPV